MLSLSSNTRIFLATDPTDMRKGFDGLFALVKTVIQQDPFSGHLFLFRNRNRDRVKILYWDRDGLAQWYKRLEKGRFQFPSDVVSHPQEPPRSCEIRADELAMLLGGIDLTHVRRRKRFERKAG